MGVAMDHVIRTVVMQDLFQATNIGPATVFMWTRNNAGSQFAHIIVEGARFPLPNENVKLELFRGSTTEHIHDEHLYSAPIHAAHGVQNTNLALRDVSS
jgi:hypothetical protein